ncbi:hypothetical protein BCU68_14245 [Vibrio sp. 10N.286.49.B3]|uniref:hypothetical protein n=1 Tax=Vibrio sp. 10N.286.49.B3 TaxID=1880855 RepID=UPI000C821BEA|nr:hypothetical protein [Vibrio sp. 10N.286.49.B3]PMH42353.1 hypothetical protein BCU68_14245 [Vibrio sp. 10N.286.49.B3]
MENNKIFLRLPNTIMSTKHNLHRELFNFNTSMEQKVFMAVLAYASAIFVKNKMKGIQHFSTVGFLADNRFLPASLVYSKLEEIINNMNNPFFDTLSIKDKKVSFEFSKRYKREVIKKGFQQINLMSLKSCITLRATQIAIMTMMKPNAYLNLNYLLDVLNINKNLKRTGRIREIKNVFKSLEILGLISEWEYKHPATKSAEVLPNHYKFHYKNTPVKSNEESKEFIVEDPLTKDGNYNNLNLLKDYKEQTVEENLKEKERYNEHIKNLKKIGVEDKQFMINGLDREPISPMGHTDYLNYVEEPRSEKVINPSKSNLPKFKKLSSDDELTNELKDLKLDV